MINGAGFLINNLKFQTSIYNEWEINDGGDISQYIKTVEEGCLGDFKEIPAS